MPGENKDKGDGVEGRDEDGVNGSSKLTPELETGVVGTEGIIKIGFSVAFTSPIEANSCFVDEVFDELDDVTTVAASLVLFVSSLTLFSGLLTSS